MSAAEVADAVVETIACERFGFVVVNFANGPIVGHTGFMDAAMRAVEAPDREAGRVLGAAVGHGCSRRSNRSRLLRWTVLAWPSPVEALQ